MPMIDVYAPVGSIPASKTEALLDQLATVLLKAEKAPDTEFFREITWVYLHEVPTVHVGGRPAGQPRLRVQVTVPAGALSQRRKDELARAVYEAVAGAAGHEIDGERALHVWTIITEVPDGNWSAGGATIRYTDLVSISAAEGAAS